MINMARSHEVLKKRLRRFLGGNTRIDSTELQYEILPYLRQAGSVALIGGAARDVARVGAARFRSDLDFVVYNSDRDRFIELMSRANAAANRYGGYNLKFKRWKVDVWALEDTWARTAGIRRVDSLPDLLDCTFFNWDAVIFDLASERLLTKDNYFEALESGLLELNLEENPNPRGCLIRALRRGIMWQVRFGPRLTNFVRRQLSARDWGEIVALESATFQRPLLKTLEWDPLRERLWRDVAWQDMLVTEPFGVGAYQLEFRFRPS